MVERLLLFSLRHPRLALGLVLAITLGFAAQLPRLRPDVRLEKVFPDRDPGLADYKRLEAAFGKDDLTAYAVLEMPGDVLSAEHIARIHSLTESLRAMPYADGEAVVSLSHATIVRVLDDDALDVGPLYRPSRAEGWDPEAAAALVLEHPLYRDRLVSGDRHLAGFLVPMRERNPDAGHRQVFARAVQQFFQEHTLPGEKAWLDGFAISQERVLSRLRGDTALFFPLAIALVLLTIGLAFRRLLPTLLTVALLVLALLWTVGTLPLLDIPWSWMSSVVPVMLLVVCVGDAVHLLGRFYNRIGAGIPRAQAAEEAVREVGGACFFTSATTAAGFGSLATSQAEIVRELGVPVALGVLYAYVLTLLLLPPALAAFPAGPAERGAGLASHLNPFLAWLSDLIRRRAGAVALASMGLFGLCLAAAPGVSRENRMLQDFDPEDPIMATRLFFEERLGGVVPVELLIDAGAPGRAMEPALQRDLLALEQTLRGPRFRELGVLHVLGLPDLLSDAWATWQGRAPGTAGQLPDDLDALHQLRFLYGWSVPDPTRELMDDPDRPRLLRLQLRIRNLYTSQLFELTDEVAREARAALPDWVEVTVTGKGVMSQAIHRSLVNDMTRSIGTAILLVGALILIAFRSPRLALLALPPNLLPLAGVLGFMAVAGIALSLTTSIVFAIVFGIAVDDSIHFLATYRSHERAGVDDPIGTTLRGTGRALILSSVVLVAGYGVMWLSSFKPNRTFGVLVSVTLVLALVGDLCLLPAQLWLLERWRRRGVVGGEARG